MADLKGYRKEFISQKGQKVIIRPLQADDSVDALLRFINDLADEDTFITVTRRFTREEEEGWLFRRLEAIDEGKGFTLLALSGERIVASAGVDRKGSRTEHVGELGIAVSRGFRDEGLGTALLEEAIGLARDFLRVAMLTLRVFGANARAQHVYQKVGFVECGRIPGAILYQGQYIDEVLMYLDMTKEG